jgi:D-alanyl-D-alanine dipeptidase
MIVRIFLLTILLFSSSGVIAQKENKYGLKVISDPDILFKQVQEDSSNKLINLHKLMPDLCLDIKYATNQNIFYTKLYRTSQAYLRLPAAKALNKVEQELNKKGLGLKIYDAYRPYQITCKMFEMLPDTIYMGLPWKGSNHNRGIAVDLTLIDFKSKKELDMPTPFDALVYASHPNYNKIAQDVIENREILKSIMAKYGFKVDPVEWWHYNYVGIKNFDILDIPFQHIEKELPIGGKTVPKRHKKTPKS